MHMAIASDLFPPLPVLRERVGVRVLSVFGTTCDCPGFMQIHDRFFVGALTTDWFLKR